MAPSALRAVAASLTLVAVLATTGRAHADDDAARKAEAKRLKDRGAQLLDKGQYQDALDQFQAAYRAYPSPNLRFNLGLALARLGRDAEAARQFEAFVDEAKEAPESAKAYARREVAELDARIGRVAVAATVAGAVVALDGVELGKTPLLRPVPVMPGAHDVALSREGYQPFATRVSVNAGGVVRVEAQLVEIKHEAPPVAVAAAPAPAPPPPAATPIYKKWWLWTAVGVVVAAGVATGVGIAASQGPSCSPDPGSGYLGCYSIDSFSLTQ